MLIKFKVKDIKKDFVYLKNKNNEELKIKRKALPENININEEIKISLFKKEAQNQEDLSKNILNEILNTSENK